MKIWITGIAGFLGSHLAESLMAKGHQVVGNDNFSGGDRQNIPAGATWYERDCCSFHAMANAMKMWEPDVVYHCAALAHEGLSSFSPALIADNVGQASISVFSAAIAAGVKRIVFCSSMARYGWGIPGTQMKPPFAEHYPTAPVDPYGIAKVQAEETLKVLARTHRVEYRIAVPHNIIGTRQCYTDPFRNVASIFLNRLKQGKPGIIYGDGEQQRCFSPVKDIIPCLEKLGLDDDLGICGVWNLGPDSGTITVNQLYELCQEVSGVRMPPIRKDGRPNEVKDAWCTADKARADLGFTETTSIKECLSEMWAAIPDGGRPFVYDNRIIEIEDGCPETWKERLM